MNTEMIYYSPYIYCYWSGKLLYTPEGLFLYGYVSDGFVYKPCLLVYNMSSN